MIPMLLAGAICVAAAVGVLALLAALAMEARAERRVAYRDETGLDVLSLWPTCDEIDRLRDAGL